MITLPKIIFALVMGGLMSFTITFAIAIVREGATSNFLWLWFDAWSIAYPVAIVCILVYRPISEWVTTALVKSLK
jgi:Protein of unknown function (DUF2798)